MTSLDDIEISQCQSTILPGPGYNCLRDTFSNTRDHSWRILRVKLRSHDLSLWDRCGGFLYYVRMESANPIMKLADMYEYPSNIDRQVPTKPLTMFSCPCKPYTCSDECDNLFTRQVVIILHSNGLYKNITDTEWESLKNVKLTLHRYPPVVNEPHVVSVDSIRPLMVREMELRGNELRQAAYEGRGWGGPDVGGWGGVWGDCRYMLKCGTSLLLHTLVLVNRNQ